MALDSLVEYADNTLTKAHHLVFSIKGRVDCARTIFNNRMVAVQTTRAVRTELGGSTIKIDGSLFKIGVRALNALTLTRSIACVIETSQPESTSVSGKRPFANPDVVLDLFGFAHKAFVIVTVTANVSVRTIPSKVSVGVHDNVLVVVVCKHVVPKDI